MQNRFHTTDPQIAWIRAAVKTQMAVKQHTQTNVGIATGLSQSQISRFLGGQGKRVTRNLEALCRYADLQIRSHNAKTEAEYQLSQAVHHAIGNNVAAAQALIRIVQALTPALRLIPSEAPSIEEPRDD